MQVDVAVEDLACVMNQVKLLQVYTNTDSDDTAADNLDYY